MLQKNWSHGLDGGEKAIFNQQIELYRGMAPILLACTSGIIGFMSESNQTRLLIACGWIKWRAFFLLVDLKYFVLKRNEIMRVIFRE